MVEEGFFFFFSFPSKPLLLVFRIVPISCFCITGEKADTLKNEEQGSVYNQEGSLGDMGGAQLISVMMGLGEEPLCFSPLKKTCPCVCVSL